MSETPIFKRAYLRGLNAELMRQGVVAYPTKEAADHAADYVADNSAVPDPIKEGQAITLKVAAVLCDTLISASQSMCKQAGHYDSSLTKTAQSMSHEDSAFVDARAIMEKAASETGALIEGGDVPNDQPAAAANNAEAALENKNRPENYANLGEGGVGNYERKGQGSVGTEEAHPEAPAATGEGSNSVTENTAKHGSSLADIVAKVAGDTGSLIQPGKDQNDQPAAAAENAEAALEAKERPENYANKGEKGVGRSDMVPSPGSQIGTEQAHPKAPAATDSGKTNVPIEHISKSAAFETLFKVAAEELVPYLPKDMDEETKVAHVRTMLGMETGSRAAYLGDLWDTLGATKEAAESVRDHYFKTASAPALPPALQKAAEEDEECDSEDSDEKEEDSSEDKGDDEEKNENPFAKKEASSTLSALRAAVSNLSR